MMSSHSGSLRRSDPGGFTTTYTVPSSTRRIAESKNMTSAIPLAGFSPPSKGYFSPSASLPDSRTDSIPVANMPSAVPTRGRRRESLTGQMRRKASETASAAGGGSGIAMSRLPTGPTSPIGRAIPMAMRSPRLGSADLGSLSTSFGAAAEALSLSSSVTSNATVNANFPSLNHEPCYQGHTHFGQQCFGPSSNDPPAPSASLLSSSVGGVPEMGMNHERRASVSSTGTVEDEDGKGMAMSSGNQHFHRCESCAKVYRHPSCLVKHRWEHTVYWKEASKFLLSKHQQVQLLEAAAILVGMDSHGARSLPEEKALWPAAVSPPASGLLGSEQINFQTLMASKNRNTSATATSAAAASSALSPGRAQTPSLVANDSSDGSTTGTCDPSMRSGTLSPLSGLGQLRLHGDSNERHGGYSSSKHDGRQLGRFRLDDTDTIVSGSGSERADRSGSAEMEDDDEDDDDEEADGGQHEQERYGMDAGGDVMAHMEMDDVN